MKTYNSQNLPLEHVVKSGRDILHYNVLVRRTPATPAIPGSKKPSDFLNGQESPTYNLDNYTIENAVKTVNKLGIPAIIEIEFKQYPSSYTPDPIRVVLFPLSIELQSDDVTFVNEYIYAHNDSYARDMADKLRTQGVDLGALEAQKIEIVKEQIRRSIIWQYLLEKTRTTENPQREKMLRWIESLNIINDHYDIRQIAAEDVELRHLSEITSDDNDYAKSVEAFSRELQTIRLYNGMKTVFAFKTPGLHVIGLKIGNTPEEIEKNAQFDKLLTQHIADQVHFETMIDRYKRIVPKPLPQTPTSKPKKSANQTSVTKPAQPNDN